MYLELTSAATSEMPALVPVVEIDGQVYPGLHALTIEDVAGVVPGSCRLRYTPSRDVSGPMTLNRYRVDSLRFGARVRVYQGDRILFQGALMRREDSGRADAVIWTALDDRHLLAMIPIRGCLVYDPSGSPEVKFIPRYQPRTNPNGYWNCVGASVEGNVYPVFAHTAYLGRTYESPTDAYEKLERSKLTAWTPRLFLQYLQLLQTITPYGDYDGIVAEHWRSLYGSARLAWNLQEILDLYGADPAQGSMQGGDQTDPLDRKMPDLDFQGQALGLAIRRTLEVAGTHDVRLRYEPADTGGGKSYLELFQVGYTALYTGQGIEILVKRGGDADDVNTAYDFQVHEDATRLAESVLVEGDVVRVEGRMTAGADDLRLVKAWTDDEDEAFRRVINGGDASGDYAKIPPTQGDAYDASTWVDADGSSGRPYALKRTREAANLARQLYPNVFKAFYLDTSKLSALLDGQADEFADTAKYPRLDVTGGRPILAHQLQYLQRDMSSGEDVTNLLREQYPVRISVRSSGNWYDALYTAGLRVTGDGRIWIDGLAEDVNGQYQCIYSGDYESDPMSMALKNLRINAATVMDHRVFGYRAISYAATKLADSFYAGSDYMAMDGLPMLYVDSPGAYREHHQVESYPAGNDSWYGGADGSSLASAPLTRMAPPGSERRHAEYAAERKLALSRHPYRASTWTLVGVRPEYRAGTWISRVTPVDGDDADTPYLIEAPLTRVTWDLVAQTTTCGGLASQLGG